MTGVVKVYKVWAILEKIEKLNFGDNCLDYGLMRVEVDNFFQIDRV